MKILIISRLFPPDTGGIQTYSYQIAKYFQRAEHETLVICPHSEKEQEFDKKQFFKINRIWGGKIKWFKLFFFLCSYFISILKFRPQVIISTIWAPCGVTAFLGRFFTEIPYVTLIHGTEMGHWKDHFPGKYLLKLTLNSSNLIISNSQFTSDYAISMGIKKKLIYTIPCGVDIERFNKKVIPNHKNSENKIILSLAALIPRKGIDNVLKALPEVKKIYPKFVYRIGGKGPDFSRLNCIVQELGIEDYVEFLGKVPDEDVPSHFASCDVFIMNSRKIGEDFEGFGIVFLEANACGKPVIAGNSGGIPDAVIHEKTGFLVSPDDIEEIKMAILTLLQNENLAKKMGEYGEEHAKNFHWQIITSHILKVIEERVIK